MRSLRRLYRRMLLADRWFERSPLGQALGVFALCTLFYQILFLFGIYQ